ncbi:hypothetical protein DFQ28_002630 [Apophysomyces sp. BC1034]|nr:hypothetical protein DFQ30_002915 [Apophysomyces sp. BC1015]KAG0179765.1 hypothetical protein DFQ29_001675 [Apophysomyces sp. BC1021]KAG0189996.1 hypothetical protein DFQ28_002630 [Apophysomyces sp. BC1034]
MYRRQDVSRRDRTNVFERLGPASYREGRYGADRDDYARGRTDDRARPFERSVGSSRSSGPPMIVTEANSPSTSRPEVLNGSGRNPRGRPLAARPAQHSGYAGYRQGRPPYQQEPRRGDRYRPDHQSPSRRRSRELTEDLNADTKRSEIKEVSTGPHDDELDKSEKNENATVVVKETVISLEADEGEEDEIMRPDWGGDSDEEETTRSAGKSSSLREKEKQEVKGVPSTGAVVENDLPHPWREILSSKGEIYYYNPETDQSVWNRPTVEQNGLAKNDRRQGEHDTKRQNKDEQRRRSHPTEEYVRSESKRARHNEGAGPTRPEYSAQTDLYRRTSPVSIPAAGPMTPVPKVPPYDERALYDRDRRVYHHNTGDMNRHTLAKTGSGVSAMHQWPRAMNERSTGPRPFQDRHEEVMRARNNPRDYGKVVEARRRTYR